MTYPKVGDTITVMFKWHSATGIVDDLVGVIDEMPYWVQIDNVIIATHQAESVTIIKSAATGGDK